MATDHEHWRARPLLAGAVRTAVYVLPPALAIAFGWATATWLPADRLGIPVWAWLIAEIALATALVLVTARVLRRMLPLGLILTMALTFPDEAPSRLSVAMRTFSTGLLRHRVEEARRNPVPVTGADAHAADLLALVAALAVHDPTSRGHSERVQAYAALVAEEMHLPPAEIDKLRWAALLHDVGKLRVPSSVLARPDKQTEAERRLIAEHPQVGLELAAPLAGFLGEWQHTIGQHHERWDGLGYPAGLAGEQIHLGARILAVADAYDHVTSAPTGMRSVSPATARAELAQRAGTQFDPAVVRAFLSVGVGRMRPHAGPLAALAGLPGLRLIPELASGGAVSAWLSNGTAATTAALGLLVGGIAGPGVTGPQTPAEASPDTAAVVEVAEPTPSPTAVTEEPRMPRTETATPAPTPTPTATPSATPSPSTTPSATPSAKPSASPTPAPTATPTSTPTPTPTPSADCSTVSPDELALCSLRGATLTGDWSGLNLAGRDLTGAHLVDVVMVGATLDGATLTGAVLERVDLSSASMVGANLSRAALTDVTAVSANLTDASLAGASLWNVNLTSATLSGVDLSGATIAAAAAVPVAEGLAATYDLHQRLVLRYATLIGANLSGASLPGVDLKWANLTDARLVGTDLTEAWLKYTVLTRADLTDAVARYAEVYQTVLDQAVLVRTRLCGASYQPASWVGAVFQDTECPSGGTSSTGCWG